ncbi:hypothetical protein [Paraburkholderia hayleyella]|uniref:hypothetical protein n=1 Tax=Paraburkholderia hayleyella TaxID=2152889 RepID=UPI001291AB02|nr:hypothetical protein [Paraburkholderia hayleyella]
MQKYELNYVIRPFFSVKFMRISIYSVAFLLFMLGLFFPAVNYTDGGVASRICNIARYIPIARALGVHGHYPCVVAVSYGGATVLGLFAGIMMCFCYYPEPFLVDFLHDGGAKKRISMIIILLMIIVGAWTISSPPPTLGLLGVLSSGRIGISIGAPGYFGAQLASWMFLILMLKFYFFNSEIRK